MHNKNQIFLIFSILFVILATVSAVFYIYKQNKKLSLDYVINQCKDDGEYEELYNEEVDDYSYEKILKANKWYCVNDNFNEIIKFKEETKSSRITYAVRMDTRVQIGNGSNTFNYELGRIVVDTTDSKASKCTHNYRGKADWFSCTEKEFISSLPKIGVLKAEAFKPLEKIIKERQDLMIKSYDDKAWTTYDDVKSGEIEDLFKKQLEMLRNTTIKKE